MGQKYEKAFEAIENVICEGNPVTALENFRGLRDELDIRIEAVENEVLAMEHGTKYESHGDGSMSIHLGADAVKQFLKELNYCEANPISVDIHRFMMRLVVTKKEVL